MITFESRLLKNAVQIIEMYIWAYKLRSDIAQNFRGQIIRDFRRKLVAADVVVVIEA